MRCQENFTKGALKAGFSLNGSISIGLLNSPEASAVKAIVGSSPGMSVTTALEANSPFPS
ncbi:hypothetical protein [Porphyromonas sp.]|uniref:hypothetical protein n=1 Tax=Porphyromonas sp. TaxID=1924944 RepID=UPI0026DC2595|nr:hypothetical protein [Porphyromonas sp.]MDO4770823.1 hypothetical protein [Porphyromonas sp.]